MSVLIKGLEMPQEKKITLTLFPDGRVYENHGERLWGHGEDCIPWKAVPVPEHGRLIESKAFLKVAHETDDFSLDELAHLAVLVAATPTIIPEDEMV